MMADRETSWRVLEILDNCMKRFGNFCKLFQVDVERSSVQANLALFLKVLYVRKVNLKLSAARGK
jgi:hypothetical protein